MLLHRKNDSRDASSRSLSAMTEPGAAPGGVRSNRNTNSGSDRIAWTPSLTPASKSPWFVRAPRIERIR